MAEIGIRKTVKGGFDEVLARLPEVLKAEGFGVLTRIDVKQTLKEKIGVDFRRYQILGACNPKFAHQALSTELGGRRAPPVQRRGVGGGRRPRDGERGGSAPDHRRGGPGAAARSPTRCASGSRAPSPPCSRREPSRRPEAPTGPWTGTSPSSSSSSGWILLQWFVLPRFGVST